MTLPLQPAVFLQVGEHLQGLDLRFDAVVISRKNDEGIVDADGQRFHGLEHVVGRFLFAGPRDDSEGGFDLSKLVEDHPAVAHLGDRAHLLIVTGIAESETGTADKHGVELICASQDEVCVGAFGIFRGSGGPKYGHLVSLSIPLHSVFPPDIQKLF